VKGTGRGLLLLVALLASGSLFAHARSESYSEWQITDSGMNGTVTVSAGEAMVLLDPGAAEPLAGLFAAHLESAVSVGTAGGPCAAGRAVRLDAARGFLRAEIRFDCGGEAPTTLEYRALFAALPAHVHYARIFEAGRLLAEQVVTVRASTWHRGEASTRRSFTAFLDLGLRHILSGIDHIAFLGGMLLVAGTLGRSVAAVTGFTLGHSLSLAAAVLGLLKAEGRLVEAFIGFTVALVAVEYFLSRRPDSRSLPAVTAAIAWLTGALALAAGRIETQALLAYLGFGAFALCYLLATARGRPNEGKGSPWVLFVVTATFGLVHGFGFAGFLMDTGVEGTSLAVALLGFNLGVELGQVALVALAFLAMWLLAMSPVQRLAPAAAAALCGIGAFWFVGRSLAV